MTKIQPTTGIRTKSGGARSIEDGKGPAGSGLSLVSLGSRTVAAKTQRPRTTADAEGVRYTIQGFRVLIKNDFEV